MEASNESIAVDFIDHLETIQRRSEQTVRTYRYTLNYWLSWLGDKPLAEVRPQDVEQWASRLRRYGKQPAAATMRREIVVVRTFHQWAAERGYGAAMVLSAHAPSVKYRTPKPITDEVWLQLWRSDLIDSDRMWLGLGYFGGLRRVEMVTLRPQDVNPVEGNMRFVRKGGSPEPIEYIAMGAWLKGEVPVYEGFENWCDVLESQWARRIELNANLLWWESIGATAADSERMARRLRRLLKACGLPGGAFTLHQMRHSCATNLMRAGCPPELIRDALSHSSWDITSHYTKTSGQLERALERRG